MKLILKTLMCIPWGSSGWGTNVRTSR